MKLGLGIFEQHYNLELSVGFKAVNSLHFHILSFYESRPHQVHYLAEIRSSSHGGRLKAIYRNSMRPSVRIPPNFWIRGGLSARCFTSSAPLSSGRATPYQQLQEYYRDGINPLFPSSDIRPPIIDLYRRTASSNTSRNTFSTTSRVSAISFRDLKSDAKSKESPSQPGKKESTEETSRANQEDPAEKAYREARKESEASRHNSKRQREKEESSKDGEEDNAGRNEEGQKKKEEPPPPPPHGNKSPWQVFTETLRSEFQASKEWNESTKQLASSAHQFTENESVKRARAAYTAASGAATSSTASAIKGTGKAIGQGAAWTWDSTVVKGVRTGVNATASGIDKVTKPVRDTNVYKTAVGGVKDVIDDGSSSRYGGWVEKEERRKQRELRELNEAGPTGRPGKRVEKAEEDPK